jgi:hypothetical protein
MEPRRDCQGASDEVAVLMGRFIEIRDLCRMAGTLALVTLAAFALNLKVPSVVLARTRRGSNGVVGDSRLGDKARSRSRKDDHSSGLVGDLPLDSVIELALSFKAGHASLPLAICVSSVMR